MSRGIPTLLLLVASIQGSPAPRKETYLGKEAWTLESPAAKAQAIVLPEVGGRLVRYSLAGESILWDNPGADGAPRPGGGYQLDVGPEMRIIPPHPALWSGPYSSQVEGDALTLRSGEDPTLRLTLEKRITMSGTDGSLKFGQKIRNLADREQRYCLWDRTLCKSGGFALFKVNPRSRFKAGWVIGKRKDKAWEYDGDAPSHPDIKALDGVIVARAKGPEQKIGADTDGGWIAYVRGSFLFVKYFPYEANGRYTDGGLSVAFYFNDRIAELEPISPEATLAPGGEYEFPEHWTLTRLDREVATHEDARALVARIDERKVMNR